MCLFPNIKHGAYPLNWETVVLEMERTVALQVSENTLLEEH